MKYCALVCLLLLAGCSGTSYTNSPDYILYNLNHGFTGHPANVFFYRFGYPVGLFEHANGTKEYQWVSGQPKIKPAESKISTTYPEEGKDVLINTYRGVIQRQYCELRIYTDREENITGFAIAVDSVGKTTPSHCAEIFDGTYY